ncbi:S1/P1 nuclease [Rhodopseudomonas sp. RCAM05734]|uniref:S1/P1 nuclease n=1 Tax=Rhodopseudomonas sp. RCAM05734 TaxID=3457549 RepID=UPI0040440714
MIGTPGSGFAWGELGHRTVAEIASRHLSQPATAEVRDLLGEGPQAMAEVSVWADAIREEDRLETYDLHVVEIPPDRIRYDRARDCK